MLSFASLRCTHCLTPAARCFVEYSRGNIRLLTCEQCARVVDKYVECDVFVVLLDLLLLRTPAFVHFVYNRRLLWRSVSSSSSSSPSSSSSLPTTSSLSPDSLWSVKFALLVLVFESALALVDARGERALPLPLAFESACFWTLFSLASVKCVGVACALSLAQRALCTPAALVNTVHDEPPPSSSSPSSSSSSSSTSSSSSSSSSSSQRRRPVLSTPSFSTTLANVARALVIASYARLFMPFMVIWRYPDAFRHVVAAHVFLSTAIVVRVLLPCAATDDDSARTRACRPRPWSSALLLTACVYAAVRLPLQHAAEHSAAWAACADDAAGGGSTATLPPPLLPSPPLPLPPPPPPA